MRRRSSCEAAALAWMHAPLAEHLRAWPAGRELLPEQRLADEGADDEFQEDAFRLSRLAMCGFL